MTPAEIKSALRSAETEADLGRVADRWPAVLDMAAVDFGGTMDLVRMWLEVKHEVTDG